MPVERSRADRAATLRTRLVPGRDDLVDLAFTTLLVALALFGFRTVFFGWEWILAGAGGLVLGLLVAHLVTAYRLPSVVTMLGLAAAYLLFGGPLAVNDHLVAGVFPSGRTIQDLLQAAVHGWKRLLTLLPPVDATVTLLALPLIVGLVAAAVTYTVARRRAHGYAVVVPPLAALALTIVLGTLEPANLIAQGVVFGLLAVGWMIVRSTRSRAPLQNGAGRGARAGIGATLLALAAAVGLVAGPHLPGTDGDLRRVARTEIVPPFDIAQFPSPLAGFRKYTEPNDAKLYDTELMKVTGAPAGTPLRFATLDYYDGGVWGAGARAGADSPRPGTAFQQVGERVSARGEGKPATLQVTIPEGGYSDVWLPTVGQVTGVKFAGARAEQLASRLWLNIDTSTAIVPDRVSAGDRYTMDVLLPTRVVREKLPTSLATATGNLAQSQELGFLDERVEAWGADAQNPWDELRAVAAAMKNDGAYTDGGTKNSVESYYLAGHSRGRLARFVGATQLAGNDEQYAATLALVANRFDIPTRVVMGAELPQDGVVRGKDVHAWVEVQDATGSWVPLLSDTFVPNRNQKPNQLQSKTDEQKIGALVPPPAGVNPPSVLQGPDQAQNAVNLKKPPKKLFDPASWPTWLRWLVFYVLLPLLALVAVYWLIRGAKAWRRRRHATRGTTTARIAWAWDDLMNSARSYGHTLPRRATRLEQAGALGRLESANGLATQANALIFGPGTPESDDARDYWRSTNQARGDLRANCDFWRRLRSDIDPRPLFARGPATPDRRRTRSTFTALTRRTAAS
ncbi:Transglutaminase-like superfamily protein [Pedococcus dokdonensis]|uniref:Transglutaminase-like superfamily protein n=2 Tax=Pedococcus dokdonensis TaxID=443156 RepID=A0A1H0TGK3_9MICO|nr:Transglutaminase-like superfamily protein [Pedococcus dokdonensis]